MVRKLAGLFGVVALVIAVGAFYVLAAETGAKEPKESKAAEKTETKAEVKAETPAPRPEAPPPTRTPEEIMTRSEERLKQSNASEGLILRNRQIQTAKFATDEPIGLLALKDQLKLTADQVKKIEDIAAAARTQAKAVLTKDQVAAVDKMKDTPDTMLGVSAQTRGMGRDRRAGGETGGSGR